MRLYNQTLLSFLGHVQNLAQGILKNECKIKFSRTRFLIQTTSWPLSIVTFEDSTRWGYFDSKFLTIGINARLAGRVDDITLKNLLRHELAHYLVYIEYRRDLPPHGEEFKTLCQKFNWPLEVEKASGDLLSESSSGDIKADQVIEKVKKLLALASSSNPHEAELATQKANQLILRHHLSRSDLSFDETIYIKVLITSPKRTSLMMAIYEILTHFLVRPLLHMGQSIVTLEAAGLKEQVELASYICEFLELELPKLWKEESKLKNLKGLRSKNSFYLGIARGFSEKLLQSRQSFNPEDSRALIKIEKNLDHRLKEIMGGFSQSTSSQQLDSRALESGRIKGRSLSITGAVKSTNSTYLIGN